VLNHPQIASRFRTLCSQWVINLGSLTSFIHQKSDDNSLLHRNIPKRSPCTSSAFILNISKTMKRMERAWTIGYWWF
jgi:hypothetical protein